MRVVNLGDYNVAGVEKIPLNGEKIFEIGSAAIVCGERKRKIFGIPVKSELHMLLVEGIGREIK